MRMRTTMLIGITGILLAGTLHAQVLFSENFETNYTSGDAATDYNPPGAPIWVERDGNVNNNHPEYAQIQTGSAKNGSQALGIADITNSVIARIASVNITNSLTYWQAWVKSEATNDFGLARITLRTDDGNKLFDYNVVGGLARWYDHSNSTLRSGETAYGEWHLVRVELDLTSKTYRFLVDGEEAFTGSIGASTTRINSWEIEIITNGSGSPSGQFAFYVDDLEIGVAEPPPAETVLFSADGFENPPYSEGPVANTDPVGPVAWVEWDGINSANNANPTWAAVQSGTVHNGSQALAIADVTNRVIARVVNLNVTNALSYWQASYKSEATNDFGFAQITLRTDDGNKMFGYNVLGGKAVWYDVANTALRSDNAAYGDWHDIRIVTDLDNETYRFLIGGVEAFAGTLGASTTTILSWEIDVTANASTRSPEGAHAFYVDDLEIGIAGEEATGYEGWISNYPSIGSQTNLTDNPDGDALNNLGEWAFGGRPDDPADIGEQPTGQMVQDDGRTWLEFVHVQRSDAAEAGLDYHLEFTGDLASPSWGNGNYTVVATNVTGGTFDVVTNRVPTDVENQQFIRLRVDYQ